MSSEFGRRPNSLALRFSFLGTGEKRWLTAAREETSTPTPTSSSSVAVECIFSRAGSILASLPVKAGCSSERGREGEGARGAGRDGEKDAAACLAEDRLSLSRVLPARRRKSRRSRATTFAVTEPY